MWTFEREHLLYVRLKNRTVFYISVIDVHLVFFLRQDFSSNLAFYKPIRQQRYCQSLPNTIKRLFKPRLIVHICVSV